MGSSGSREEIENQMSLIKLKRMEIQVEKEKELKKLSEMGGKLISRSAIPDYIDPEFAKQKNLYIENINEEGKKAKTDIPTQNLNKKKVFKKKENLTEISEKKEKEKVKKSNIKVKASSDNIKKEKIKKNKKDIKSKNNTKSSKKNKKTSKTEK